MMVDNAIFYLNIFKKAEALGFTIYSDEDALIAIYPGYSQQQYEKIATDKELAQLLADILKYKQ